MKYPFTYLLETSNDNKEKNEETTETPKDLRNMVDNLRGEDQVSAISSAMDDKTEVAVARNAVSNRRENPPQRISATYIPSNFKPGDTVTDNFTGIDYVVGDDGSATRASDNTEEDSSGSPWSTATKVAGGAAALAAGTAGAAHAINWYMAKRKVDKLKRRYQYEIFGCNEIKNPKRREACLKYNEDKANEELNQFIKLCDGTENPEACKQEILSGMEDLIS